MSAELAGRLRERITIERRETTRDAVGGTSGGWTPIGEWWAAVAPDGSGDIVAADRRTAAARWRITLRTGADLRIGDRLTWRGTRMRVRRRIDDPAQPDRITVETEEER
ncbi:MAG: hypothetical protein JWM75_3066 [Sphingomonas bacterium]|nr:hypothetical protein [Sphingomonas bacterium]